MPSCLPSLRACHWLSRCFKSQETHPSDGTLLATLTPVQVNVRRTIGASCFLYPSECSLECTLSWPSVGIETPLSSGRALNALLSTNHWCRASSLPATKLFSCQLVTLVSCRQWPAISTMPWHFSCRFGPSILISLRSTEDLGLSCSRPA